MVNQQESSHVDFQSEMRHGIAVLNKKIDRIQDTVEGATLGTKQQKMGIVGVLDDHDLRLRKLEKFQTWFMVSLISIGGGLGAGIVKLVESFLHKS